MNPGELAVPLTPVDPAAPPPVAAIERRIAAILSVGVKVAIGLMAVGVVLLLAAGRSPLETPWSTMDLRRLPADLVALRPEGFLWLGLIVILATPLLRVAASVIGFLAAGERRMAALGAGVLVVLTLAVLTAVTLGG
jgi:uncharacterized membrane protein